MRRKERSLFRPTSPCWVKHQSTDACGFPRLQDGHTTDRKTGLSLSRRSAVLQLKPSRKGHDPAYDRLNIAALTFCNFIFRQNCKQSVFLINLRLRQASPDAGPTLLAALPTPREAWSFRFRILRMHSRRHQKFPLLPSGRDATSCERSL